MNKFRSNQAYHLKSASAFKRPRTAQSTKQSRLVWPCEFLASRYYLHMSQYWNPNTCPANRLKISIKNIWHCLVSTDFQAMNDKALQNFRTQPRWRPRNQNSCKDYLDWTLVFLLGWLPQWQDPPSSLNEVMILSLDPLNWALVTSNRRAFFHFKNHRKRLQKLEVVFRSKW